MTILLLIRHGENEYVKSGRLAGRTSGVHLNDRGRQQARDLAVLLHEAPIRAIYSSPMERALETAQPLAEALQLPVQLAPGIIEIDFGEWTGHTLKQLYRRKLWKTVRETPQEMTFPGGESFIAAQQRVTAELQAIAARHPNEVVACFSHADAIKLATAHFLDMPLNAFQRLGAETCSVTVLVFGKEGVAVPKINQTTGFHWPEPPKANAPAPVP